MKVVRGIESARLPAAISGCHGKRSFSMPAGASRYRLGRLGPSASNKQPWRIVREGDRWHFYLQRTPRYAAVGIGKLIRIADIQRIDLGIAMCHFELTAAELGLAGQWQIGDPGLEMPDDLTEYTASWIGG